MRVERRTEAIIIVSMLCVVLVIMWPLATCAGFNLGGSGEKTIRFRPALIFEPRHASLFLQALEDTLGELK